MTKTIKTLDATRFAFTTSFPKVALATVTIEPTATPEEQIVIEGRQLYAYNAPKRLAMAPSGALTVQDKETNYRLISGGFDSQKMYYVYFRLDGQKIVGGRAVFLQLSADEYKAFNAAKITVALGPVKLPVAPTAKTAPTATEAPVTEAPATEPVTEAPAPPKALTRKQRAALKHAVAA